MNHSQTFTQEKWKHVYRKTYTQIYLAAYASTNTRMYIQTEHSCSVHSHSSKREHTIDTHYGMEHSEWKDMIPFIWPSRAGKTNLLEEIRAVVASDVESRSDRGVMREHSGLMVMFFILIGVWVAQVYTFVRTQNVHLNLCISLYVNFH